MYSVKMDPIDQPFTPETCQVTTSVAVSSVPSAQLSQPSLVHVFPTFQVGGAQVRFVQIANALGDKYKHTIIALDNQTGAEERIDPNVALTIKSHQHSSQGLLTRLKAYRSTLKQLRPDVLLTYNWGSIEWAMANATGLTRHIHIEDGFGPEEANRQLPRRVWFRRLALWPHADVIVPSRTLQSIAQDIWRLKSSQIHYIPNGIDTTRFDHGPDQKLVTSLQLPKDRPLVGTIAALRSEKNIPRLIRACARANARQPCHLIVIGDGPERTALEQLARDIDFETHVTFTGHIAEPERIMGALDVFALSSDTEQMPYSVLEAMASGLAVASVDVGDVKDMVAQANKPFIADKGDDHFVEVLETLLKDRSAREAIGEKNRTRVAQTYSQALMISRHEAMLSSER